MTLSRVFSNFRISALERRGGRCVANSPCARVVSASIARRVIGLHCDINQLGMSVLYVCYRIYRN